VSTEGTPRTPVPRQPPPASAGGQAVAEPPAATVQPQPLPQHPQGRHCPRCGAAMTDAQEWCLNCGAAVGTRIVPAPGWRVPIIVTALLAIVGVLAVAIAIIELADDTGEVTVNTDGTAQVTPTPTPGATVTPAPTIPEASGQSSPEPAPSATPSTTPAPTPSSTPGAGTGAIGTWPAGESGWTVVLASKSSESAARASAENFQGDGIPDVGLLQSDDFASLNPGYWVVFSGQYDSGDEAQSAAQAAQAQSPGAYAKQVKPK
jgi:SPOR domain